MIANLLSLILLSSSLSWPDPVLTPGAIATTDLQVICQPNYSITHRVWHKQYQTFAKYNIPWDQHKGYEDDDWYPIELGGDNANPLNHWAQPLLDSYKKNRLENYERRAACIHYRETGDRDATPYQKVFDNWGVFYKQIFGTEP